MSIQPVEAGNLLYLPETWRDGRPCMRVVKRAGRGRSRFAPPEGSLVPIKTIVYRTIEERDRALADRQAAHDEWNRQKALRRAERAKPHTFKVGDILVCSWGWEQTNVDWYTVTETTRNTVAIAKIAGRQIEKETGNSMAAYVVPVVPVEIIGQPEKHRASADGTIRLNSYSWAHLWDGREKYSSWYA